MSKTPGYIEATCISWNTHALITSFSTSDFFRDHPVKPVIVLPMEEFIHESRDELLSLGKHFHRELHGRLGLKLTLPTFCDRLESARDFFRLFRYNPESRLSYVRVFHIDELGSNVKHDQSRQGPPGHSYAPVDPGSESLAEDVFVTYSDEPDWGTDQEVFSTLEYQLGNPPFGPATGPSSQAPFHMYFPHESRTAYWLIPGLSRRLLILRAGTCLKLSKLAFEKNMSYWAWRFLAWGTHYLQDTTCPFHCCPFPPGKTSMILKIFQNPNLDKFYGANRNFIRNRHSLFESAVSYLMNDHVKKRIRSPLLDALQKNTVSSSLELEPLLKEASRLPNILAPKINNLMVNLYSSPKIDDPDYYVDEDADFVIAQVLEEAIRNRAATYGKFVHAVSECLSEAGRVTRFALKSTQLKA